MEFCNFTNHLIAPKRLDNISHNDFFVKCNNTWDWLQYLVSSSNLVRKRSKTHDEKIETARQDYAETFDNRFATHQRDSNRPYKPRKLQTKGQKVNADQERVTLVKKRKTQSETIREIYQFNGQTNCSIGFKHAVTCDIRHTTASFTGFLGDESCTITYKCCLACLLSNNIKHFDVLFLSFGLRLSNLKDDTDTIDQEKPLDLTTKKGFTDITESVPPAKICCHNHITRNIVLNNDDKVMILYMLDKPVLFKEQYRAFRFDNCSDVDTEGVIEDAKSKESIYCTLHQFVVRNVDYTTLQKMYIMFIAKKFLVYNTTLECFTMDQNLKTIHIFFGEFYVYTMWKLDQMCIQISSKDEEKYKTYLIDELKHFCLILDIYQEIRNQKESNLYFKKIVALMYYQLKLVRINILSYLEMFHRSDYTTSLFYLANNMHNIKIQNLSFNMNLCKDMPQSKTVLNIADNPNTSRIRSTYGSGVHRIKTYLYFLNHVTNYTKTPYFILAFTTNFDNLCSSKPKMIKVFKMINNARNKGKTVDRHIYRMIDDQKPFVNSFYNIIDFFQMLEVVTNNQTGFGHYDCKYFEHKRLVILERYMQFDPPTSFVNLELNIYREVILLSMGITRDNRQAV